MSSGLALQGTRQSLNPVCINCQTLETGNSVKLLGTVRLLRPSGGRGFSEKCGVSKLPPHQSNYIWKLQLPRLAIHIYMFFRVFIWSLTITIFKMQPPPPTPLQPLPEEVSSSIPSLGIDFINYKILVVGSIAWDFEGTRRGKVCSPKAPQTWGSLGACLLGLATSCSATFRQLLRFLATF